MMSGYTCERCGNLVMGGCNCSRCGCWRPVPVETFAFTPINSATNQVYPPATPEAAPVAVCWRWGNRRIAFRSVIGSCNAINADDMLLVCTAADEYVYGERCTYVLRGDDIDSFLTAYDAWCDAMARKLAKEVGAK